MTHLTEAIRRARSDHREALDSHDHPWAADLERGDVSPRDHADIRPFGAGPVLTASSVQRLQPRAQQQLRGLIDRVFLPVSGETIRSVGLAAVGQGVKSGPITAALTELLAQETHGRVCAIDANYARP